MPVALKVHLESTHCRCRERVTQPPAPTQGERGAGWRAEAAAVHMKLCRCVVEADR